MDYSPEFAKIIEDDGKLDLEKAHHYLPTEKMLKDVLKEFAQSAGEQIENLKQLKQSIEDGEAEEDFSAFRTQAHAMKSNLRFIGSDLFEEAFLLEQAGRDGKKDVVTEHTDGFLVRYREVADFAAKITGGIEEKASFDEELFFEKIREIRETMKGFRINELQDAMKTIRGMDIPAKYQEEVKMLEIAVRDLSSEDVFSSCDWLENMKKGQ